MPKFKQSPIYKKGLKDGQEEGFKNGLDVGFEKGVTHMMTTLVDEISIKLRESLENEPGIGPKMLEKIDRAVKRISDEA